MNESSPFIVTGCQSSGTTLLAHLLDRSQSIRLGLEEGIIRALLYWFWNNVSRSASGFRYSRIGDFPRIISGLRHEPRYNEVRHRLERALISMQETGELDFYLERHRVREFICRAAFLSTTLNKPNALLWGDKYPEYSFLIKELGEVFSGCKFVIVLREPEKVSYSLWTTRVRYKRTELNSEFRSSPEDCVTQWIEWNLSVLDGISELDKSQYHVFDFDDFLKNRDRQLAGLSGFLGHDLLADKQILSGLSTIDPGRSRYPEDEDFITIRKLCQGEFAQRIYVQLKTA